MELNDLFALQVGVKKVALVKTSRHLAALSRLSAHKVMLSSAFGLCRIVAGLRLAKKVGSFRTPF